MWNRVQAQRLPLRALLLLLLMALLIIPPLPALGQQGTGAGPGRPAAVERPLDRTENILLLGSDIEPGDGNWRTDTIIVFAIDRPANRVGLLSIPRDLFVDIPSVGRNRINVVDFIGEQRGGRGGGPALLNQVLSQTLGIHTQHYIRIEMRQVASLIDQLGGITVVLDKPLTELGSDPELPGKGGYFSLPAGTHHLSGSAALTYLRGRYVTGDLDRNRRQQQVIWAIGQRLKGLDWSSRVPLLLSLFSGRIQTDLSLGDALSLASFGEALTQANVHGRTFDYQLARPWTTPAGAQVLLLGDRRRVDAWINGLFDAPCPGCGEPMAAPPLAAPPAAGLQPPGLPWASFGGSLAGQCDGPARFYSVSRDCGAP